MWERPLAAIVLMLAAGFVRSCIAGKLPPTNPRLRWRSERVLVGAASGRDSADAGRRLRSRPQSRASLLPPTPGSDGDLSEFLWERPLAAIVLMQAAGFVPGCIAGKPAPTNPRLRWRSERVFMGAASGRDSADAGRRLRSRPQSRASPLPPNPGSDGDLSEFLWERPLAAIVLMQAAGFVRSCIAGKPPPTKPRFRWRAERVLVGAASGRDSADAGRRLRSRPQSRASPLPPNPGSDGGLSEFLWERPLAAIVLMLAAGFVPGCIAGKPPPTNPLLRWRSERVFMGAASGRDSADAGRRLRSRPQSRASPLPPNPGSDGDLSEFLWEILCVPAQAFSCCFGT